MTSEGAGDRGQSLRYSVPKELTPNKTLHAGAFLAASTSHMLPHIAAGRTEPCPHSSSGRG